MQRLLTRMLVCLPLILAVAIVLGACEAAPSAPTAAAATPATAQTQASAAPTLAPTRTPATPTAAAPAARNVTVLAGAGQENQVVMAFLPETVRVRAGDTVTWKHNMEEIMTVTFLGAEPLPAVNVPVPGGSPTDRMRNPKMFFPTRAADAPVETYQGTNYVGSGVLSKQPFPGAPANETFSLKFDKPGLYHYVNVVAPEARGTVEVVDASSGDVPEQAQLDAQAKTELGALVAPYDAIRQQGQQPRVEPGPRNSQIVFVRAGSVDFRTGDQRSQLFEFLPKVLTIKAGDTVVWSSNFIHTVTFQPVPPPPDRLLPKPQPQGPPQVILNPQVFLPAEPAASYDPAKYFNSAPIGLQTPNGNNWSLTFDTAGTYEYFCALHWDLGMKATIVVQPK